MSTGERSFFWRHLIFIIPAGPLNCFPAMPYRNGRMHIAFPARHNYSSLMPVLDFKEIPFAHASGGDLDAFELFAREVLTFIGYTIVEDPSRGPDGGKDLIVSESRKGVGGETRIRWLVSCKHKAASKKAIGVGDEPSILERVKCKRCQGF